MSDNSWKSCQFSSPEKGFRLYLVGQSERKTTLRILIIPVVHAGRSRSTRLRLWCGAAFTWASAPLLPVSAPLPEFTGAALVTVITTQEKEGAYGILICLIFFLLPHVQNAVLTFLAEKHFESPPPIYSVRCIFLFLFFNKIKSFHDWSWIYGTWNLPTPKATNVTSGTECLCSFRTSFLRPGDLKIRRNGLWFLIRTQKASKHARSQAGWIFHSPDSVGPSDIFYIQCVRPRVHAMCRCGLSSDELNHGWWIFAIGKVTHSIWWNVLVQPIFKKKRLISYFGQFVRGLEWIHLQHNFSCPWRAGWLFLVGGVTAQSCDTS